MDSPISNIAAYQFVPLRDLGPLRARLLSLCNEWQLKGTILLSPEGINLFVAGVSDGIERLLMALRALPGLENLAVKKSDSQYQPFNRMLVRIKKEIIAFGVEGIDPGRHTSPKLPPHVFKSWLDQGKPVLLLDTRNNYEVSLGTFRNAMAIGVDHFREFPEAVDKLPAALKEQPIVMFCTGGIRCEKAGPFMERAGFSQIFQLEGGILKYFEECGSAHYEGDCFVFDRRVSVDPKLRETDSSQCFACLTPLTPAEQEDPRYVPNQSCPHCFKTPEERLQETLLRRHEAIRQAMQPLPGSIPYENLVPVHIPGKCDQMPLIAALCQIVRSLSPQDWEKEFAQQLVLNDAHETVAPTHRVRSGQRYLHKFPKITEPEVNGDIRILYEDEALIVVNKPAPLPMHPGGRFNRNTLQHILHTVYYPLWPRPAHRLDADTTGVTLMTRTRRFAALLQPQFERGEVKKHYLVRVYGHPKEDRLYCAAPITSQSGDAGTRAVAMEGGLAAQTEFRVLRRYEDGTALLEAKPLTGRTNQIRLHLLHLGFPVRGDAVYQNARKDGQVQTSPVSAPPLCLHSWRIAFTHPLTAKPVEFTAPPPAWAE